MMETIADFPQGRPVSSAVTAMRQCPADAALPLDPLLGRLLTAAHNLAGFSLLLLLARDPSTADTAAGFADRLCHPVSEVKTALEALRTCGIVTASAPSGGDCPPTYYLVDDTTLVSTLRRLAGLYQSGSGGRSGLLCALPAAA